MFRELMMLLCFCGQASAIEALEVSHTLVQTMRMLDNKFFFYRLHVQGENISNKKFDIVSVNCAQRPFVPAQVYFDSEGTAWYCEGKNKCILEKFEFLFANFYDGETVELVLYDGKEVMGSTKICPKPIESITSDGASVSLQLYGSNFYTMDGKGFKPKETLLFILKSGTEVVGPTDFAVYDNGSFVSTIIPSVIGKTCGRASITILRKDGTQIYLPFVWGTTPEKLASLIVKGSENNNQL